MKNFILSLFAIFVVSQAAAQQNPVKWSATYKSLSAGEGEVIITADIEKGWHTYSQRPAPDGPIPTSFSFTPSKDYSLDGKTEESNPHEEYVKAFEAKMYVFNGKAEFKQKVKLNKKGISIPFKVEYMSCNDMMCLPPKTIELSVKAL
jgi:DsbC/DsbD-like thiol-disulfide interchange protein